VIYYWAKKQDIILMLLVYGKNEQNDLSTDQKKALRGIIQEEFQ